ncbi:carboxypeptidase-like regulatory domain-containing protein [Paenibacillus montanisoli]|uniref:carboxypeptidase-like regulatory domain-containing protein n=1 Tax=Paenibacillus montanisoli TaxID=2081970 RepID=UPI0014036515|nr:carboxypeptidase-like regulatory domain-containing protein [Paenibacillus montanisoli]
MKKRRFFLTFFILLYYTNYDKISIGVNNMGGANGMKQKKLLVVATVVLLGLFLFVANSFADSSNDNSSKGIPQRLAELENWFASLKQSVVSSETDISTLKDNENQQNNQISSLTSLVTSLQHDVSDVKQTIASRDEKISSLEQLTTNQQSQISNLETQVAALQSQIQQLQSNVGHKVSGSMVDSNNKPFFSGIELIDQSGKHYPRSTDDASIGQFSFDNIPDGTYTINFYFPEYAIDAPKQVTVSGSDTTGLVVKLAVPTYTVSGRVLDNSGEPINNQPVLLRDPHNVGGYWQPTASDGSFAMGGLAPGSYTILIGNQNSPLATADITVTDHDIQDFRITSSTGETSQPKVVGTVYGTNGEAVQGVDLRLFDEGGYYGSFTDSNGHYEVNVRETRTYPLIIAEQGYLFGSKSNLTVNSGTPVQVDLTLSLGGTIAGRISYSDGVEAQYVSIKVLDDKGNMVNRIYVNADGSYHLNAPAGVFTLQVETDTGKTLNQSVDVTAGKTLTQNFTL